MGIKWKDFPNPAPSEALFSECQDFAVIRLAFADRVAFWGVDYRFDPKWPDRGPERDTLAAAQEWCEERFRRVAVAPPDTPVVPILAAEAVAADQIEMPW